MHLLTTNISAQTFDVYGFGFESASALEIGNEYSRLDATPACRENPDTSPAVSANSSGFGKHDCYRF